MSVLLQFHEKSAKIEKSSSGLHLSNMMSSSKKPPNFCDLPIEMLEMIIKKLDLPRRVIVGRLCKTLRILVIRMKPCCCNELRMTVSSKGCELHVEGYPIKYETPLEDKLEDSLRMIMEKMCDDLLFFIPDFQLNTITFRFDDHFSYNIFRPIYKQRFPQPLEVHTLVVKQFDRSLYVAYDIINPEKTRVREKHHLEEYADDIMKVSVERYECVDITDGVKAFTRTHCIKYFREGQEDVYVDEPNLVPPKKQK
uniref:F-box domain-containing protein n=2 Tax=Caenorhabditis tropicalis TaxID=1561998 RepID=A0A1I7TX29_9PELO